MGGSFELSNQRQYCVQVWARLCESPARCKVAAIRELKDSNPSLRCYGEDVCPVFFVTYWRDGACRDGMRFVIHVRPLLGSGRSGVNNSLDARLLPCDGAFA